MINARGESKTAPFVLNVENHDVAVIVVDVEDRPPTITTSITEVCVADDRRACAVTRGW